MCCGPVPAVRATEARGLPLFPEKTPGVAVSDSAQLKSNRCAKVYPLWCNDYGMLATKNCYMEQFYLRHMTVEKKSMISDSLTLK